jgi:hypothetical protein
MRSLERNLDPVPTDGWTSYLAPLDDPSGWTRRDADGTTVPATAVDLQTAIAYAYAIWIRGRWSADAGNAQLDNFSIELRH